MAAMTGLLMSTDQGPCQAQRAPSAGISYRTGAIVFMGAILLLGLLSALNGTAAFQSDDPMRFFFYFAMAVLTSGWKVKLPQVPGTMSANFFFVLLGVVELQLGETMVLAAVSVVIQYAWRSRRRPRFMQAAFNAASILSAVVLTDVVFNSSLGREWSLQFPMRLFLASATYFFANTCPVAMIISLTESKPVFQTWRDTYFWSFPYYLVGASFAGGLHYANTRMGWQTTVLVIPIIFFIYRSYSLYLKRLEAEKSQADVQRQHAEEMAGLHLRTIEALALAIEAKDEVTHDHLQRVRVYSVEIGKEMGVSEEEMQAIIAASLLHDIGKLAVPEHIISKPGKLTPEEFEKMKIHPVVGAEILERVQFPYPVVPIVRHHHEKWDGTGYPDGLKGEEIPIGARILSAVDCLDALATDRQYRRALPLEEAMAYVQSQAGLGYDPKVVEILSRRCQELERLARGTPIEVARLNKEIRVERGEAPATGFEQTGATSQTLKKIEPAEFLNTIAAARHEAQVLFELSRDLVHSLSLHETLSLIAMRLRKLIPHDAFAVYLKEDAVLRCEYASGDDFRLFSGLRIPMGQGLSGWVADNRKPITDGNPSVEMGYLNDPKVFTKLRSALSIPLESEDTVLGALTLYSASRDAFHQDHLRVLQIVAPRLTLTIENIQRFATAESTATTDYLTGLPNARSLFLHLEDLLQKYRMNDRKASVLVCDLDGFKEVNDKLGHLEGNRILKLAASNLRDHCRPTDYVARMGGDEFVVVLPDTEAEAARNLGKRLRALLEKASRQALGDMAVSMSIGVASFPGDGPTTEAVLAEADRAMYCEKRGRRIPGTSLAQLQSALEKSSELRADATVV